MYEDYGRRSIARHGQGRVSGIPAYQAKLAEERTELARQRIVLAVERTFSAWLRTGLALTAVALIMPKLLDLGRWMWVMRIIGIVLTITATIINYAAYRQYRIGSEKLSRQGISATPLWAITIMIAALMLCTLLSIVLLFEEL